MLDDGTRARLTPLKAQLDAARAEANEADRLLSAAESELASLKQETSWRDRLPYGALSNNPALARRYGEARSELRTLTRLAGKRADAVDRLADKLDAQIERSLGRHDPQYRRLVTAIRHCDDAIHQCVAMKSHVDEAATAARTAVGIARTRSATRDDDFAAAVGQYDALIVKIRGGMPALIKQFTAAGQSTGHIADQPRLPSAVPFGRPSAGDVTVARSGRLSAAVRPLQTFSNQLGRSTDNVRGWRARADDARRAALRAAHDLI